MYIRFLPSDTIVYDLCALYGLKRNKRKEGAGRVNEKLYIECYSPVLKILFLFSALQLPKFLSLALGNSGVLFILFPKSRLPCGGVCNLKTGYLFK